MIEGMHDCVKRWEKDVHRMCSPYVKLTCVNAIDLACDCLGGFA